MKTVWALALTAAPRPGAAPRFRRTRFLIMAAAYRLDLAQVLLLSSDAKVRLDDLTQFWVVLHVFLYPGTVVYFAVKKHSETGGSFPKGN